MFQFSNFRFDKMLVREVLFSKRKTSESRGQQLQLVDKFKNSVALAVLELAL